MEHLILNPVMRENLLHNKYILITGAGSGIGRTLAFNAAKNGATTILLGRTLKTLESLYDEITEAGFPEPAIHPLNLLRAGPNEAYELALSIKNLFGRLDAVVHNAAISGQICQVEHLPPEKWQEVIHLNLNIPYLLTHALLPLLEENIYGSIVFTIADEAFSAKAYWSAYSASKFGIIGLATSLHKELEVNTHLRVNCINPKIVRTPFRLKTYPGVDPTTLRSPQEIMPYYLYLLSDESKEIRGKIIVTE